MQLIGLLVLIIVTSVLSTIVTTKIIVAYYLKIINDFLEQYDKQIMDLIAWAKEKDKHQ